MTKITVDKALIEQAIEALKTCSGVPHWPALESVKDALRAAMAEPAVEPVAEVYQRMTGGNSFPGTGIRWLDGVGLIPTGTKLYTSPTPPAEVPLLTHGEVWAIWNGEIGVDQMNQQEAFKFAGFIETLVRQKAGLTNKPKE